MLRWNYKYGLLLCGLLAASGLQAQQSTDNASSANNGGKDDFVDAEFEEKK